MGDSIVHNKTNTRLSTIYGSWSFQCVILGERTQQKTPTALIWIWLCLECISINVAVPPNRKRHQVAFLLAFSHDENLHCNPH